MHWANSQAQRTLLDFSITREREKAFALFSGYQYGALFSAGAEALVWEFQLEVEEDARGPLLRPDSECFFSSLHREAIVDGASILESKFAACMSRDCLCISVYAWDCPSVVSRTSFLHHACHGSMRGSCFHLGTASNFYQLKFISCISSANNTPLQNSGLSHNWMSRSVLLSDWVT